MNNISEQYWAETAIKTPFGRLIADYSSYMHIKYLLIKNQKESLNIDFYIQFQNPDLAFVLK